MFNIVYGNHFNNLGILKKDLCDLSDYYNCDITNLINNLPQKYGDMWEFYNEIKEASYVNNYHSFLIYINLLENKSILIPYLKNVLKEEQNKFIYYLSSFSTMIFDRRRLMFENMRDDSLKIYLNCVLKCIDSYLFKDEFIKEFNVLKKNMFHLKEEKNFLECLRTQKYSLSFQRIIMDYYNLLLAENSSEMRKNLDILNKIDHLQLNIFEESFIIVNYDCILDEAFVSNHVKLMNNEFFIDDEFIIKYISMIRDLQNKELQTVFLKQIKIHPSLLEKCLLDIESKLEVMNMLTSDEIDNGYFDKLLLIFNEENIRKNAELCKQFIDYSKRYNRYYTYYFKNKSFSINLIEILEKLKDYSDGEVEFILKVLNKIRKTFCENIEENNLCDEKSVSYFIKRIEETILSKNLLEHQNDIYEILDSNNNELER